jgi:hypothetical protein
MDLQVGRGAVDALVSGSEIYEVGVKITPLPAPRWKALRKDCVGSIESLVELLQGNFSRGVMERMCRQETGLFPSPGEIRITCSCPDWAGLCKHAAATLYGVGARLDDRPDLLFVLRGVDGEDLVTGAAEGLSLAEGKPAAGRALGDEDLSAVFGIEMEGRAEPGAAARHAPSPPAASPGASPGASPAASPAAPPTRRAPGRKPKAKSARRPAAPRRRGRRKGGTGPSVPGFSAAELRALEALSARTTSRSKGPRKPKGG